MRASELANSANAKQSISERARASVGYVRARQGKTYRARARTEFFQSSDLFAERKYYAE